MYTTSKASSEHPGWKYEFMEKIGSGGQAVVFKAVLKNP